ncbi:MAG: methyltransferase [Oscillospiraceae bacterium]|nr:methyltransferase [Oscillospiraceae bacterium]
MNYEIFEIGEQNKIKLFISKEHRFGTDSLLLGEFTGNVKNKTVCDLCTGCGIIPIILHNAKKIYAVEIQEEAIELLTKTKQENNLNIKIIKGDLRNIPDLEIPRESVDIVTANPPYYTLNSGHERSSAAQKSARYDSTCTIEDVVNSSAYLLKFGGELKMCMTSERLTDVVSVMRSYKIEPKEITFISGKNNKARLFLISGKKGAGVGVTITWK